MTWRFGCRVELSDRGLASVCAGAKVLRPIIQADAGQLAASTVIFRGSTAFITLFGSSMCC